MLNIDWYNTYGVRRALSLTMRWCNYSTTRSHTVHGIMKNTTFIRNFSKYIEFFYLLNMYYFLGWLQCWTHLVSNTKITINFLITESHERNWFLFSKHYDKRLTFQGRRASNGTFMGICYLDRTGHWVRTIFFGWLLKQI